MVERAKIRMNQKHSTAEATNYTLLFRLYDLDKDDRISHNELFQVLCMMVGVNIPDEEPSSITGPSQRLIRMGLVPYL